MDIDLQKAAKLKELAEKELACNGLQECVDKVKQEAEEAKDIITDLKEGAQELLNGDLAGAAEELKEAAAKTGSKEAIEFAETADKAEDVISETIKDLKAGNWADMTGNLANFTALIPALVETGSKVLNKISGFGENISSFFKGLYNDIFSTSNTESNNSFEPHVELHSSDDESAIIADPIEA